MSGPVRMSVVADTRDAKTGLEQAGSAALGMGRDFDRAAEQAEAAGRQLDGVGEGADTVASKGAQAAGALGGLGDLIGGPFGAAMQTGGIAMQAAADGGDLLNVAVEGGAKLAGKAKDAFTKFSGILKSSKVVQVASTAAQWALNAAMTANPVGLIVAGIALLIGGLILAYKKSETFRTIVNGAFGSVLKVIKPIGGFIKTYITTYIDIAKKAVSGLAWFFTDGIPKGFEAFKGAAKTAFNFVADIWNNTVGKISFSIPSWVPVVGGKTFDVPDIPKFAGGGTVYGPTLALLGDNPSGVEYAIPKEVLDKMSGRGGPTIVIEGGIFIGATKAEVGKWLQECIEEFLSAGGRLRAA